MPDPAELIANMTLEEKATLLSGADFWHTAAIPRLNIPQLTVSDGPHGLRKVEEGSGEEAKSTPATCFPAAATAACSFDRKLMYEVGNALGEECRAQEVDVLLGPGINIKRNPLCGRNFEYFSEDPYLAGEMASAWIKGVQSQEVGTSCKHFVANNQETRRMTIASVMDERAFHEIYLAPFERVIKGARPWTVMTSYNRVMTDWQDTAARAQALPSKPGQKDATAQGASQEDKTSEHVAESPLLMTNILKKELGFEGVAVSDWGAVENHIGAVKAGLDLRMPGTGPEAAAALVQAVQEGKLAEADIDRAVSRILQLVEQASKRKPAEFNQAMQAAHHQLAYQVALESAVLLKNENNALPLAPEILHARDVDEGAAFLTSTAAQAQTDKTDGASAEASRGTAEAKGHGSLAEAAEEDANEYADNKAQDKETKEAPQNHGAAHLAIIGAFAQEPRYQGGGSSHVNPVRLESACDALDAAGIPYSYAPGYHPTKTEADQQLIEEACALAQGATQVVLFAGLPEVCESEGYDRTALELPPAQLQLIEELAQTGTPLVVVLCCGCVVDTSWQDCAQAILLAGLGGQGGGQAVVDLLLGKECPGGRLAESWPCSYEDVPSSTSFPGYEKTVEYRESIYVGYRYYDTAAAEVRYPFGFGLSYTTFAYGTPHISRDSIIAGDKVTVSIDVANTGTCPGAEVVQLYVSKLGREGMRPEQELKGFERVYLQPGQKRIVNFNLDRRAFAYYSVETHNWCVETGVYVCRLGSASRAIRAAVKIDVVSTDPKIPKLVGQADYAYTGSLAMKDFTETAFQALLRRPLPTRLRQAGDPFTADSTLGEIRGTRIGAKVFSKAMEEAALRFGDSFDREACEKMLIDMPLRSALMAGDSRVSEGRMEGLLDMLNGRLIRGLIKVIRN